MEDNELLIQNDRAPARGTFKTIPEPPSRFHFWLSYATAVILFFVGLSISNTPDCSAVQMDHDSFTASANRAKQFILDASLLVSPLASPLVSPSSKVVYPPLPIFKTREEVAAFLESEKKEVGAELGVQRGIFAKHNLRHWPSCKRYFLVDVWRHQANYVDAANENDAKQNDIYNAAVAELYQFPHKTTFMRMFTSDAAAILADDILDFVYVDARHDYCGTTEDMVMYWPKLKSGGIMAGHDFLYASEVNGQDWSVCHDGSKQPGAVRGAVEDFAKEKGLEISVTTDDAPWKTWVVRKP